MTADVQILMEKALADLFRLVRQKCELVVEVKVKKLYLDVLDVCLLQSFSLS